jgi:hypothetical protein
MVSIKSCGKKDTPSRNPNHIYTLPKTSKKKVDSSLPIPPISGRFAGHPPQKLQAPRESGMVLSRRHLVALLQEISR